MKTKRKTLYQALILIAGLVLISTARSAYADQIDVGIFESQSSDDIEIYIRPDFLIPDSLTLSGISYTVRWTDPNIDISENYYSPYFVEPQGSPVLHEGYYYQIFASVPTSPVGTDILAGEERLISSFSVSGGDCDSFEIIKNDWTGNNNADPYFELQGLDKTGIIYEPIVNLGSVGGYVTGGGVILLDQSTGTLTLEDYQGSIVKWQKSHNQGSWQDIVNTSNTYSEVPSATGTWEYRAIVQNGTCSEDTSISTEVIVLNANTLWTGVTDTNWFDLTNWSDGVPQLIQSAVIPEITRGRGNMPSIDNDTISAECRVIKIQSGATLKIGPKGRLSVTDTIVNNDGVAGLIIKSDATGSGSLIHNTEDIEATVQRYINNWTTGNEIFGWHFLSSPVLNQAIRPEFMPNGDPLPVEIDFYKWDEDFTYEGTTGWWVNSKDDNGNWNTNFEDNFTMGAGYLTAYEGPDYGNTSKEFKGVINVDDVAVSNLTHTPESTHPGWNLLGNPFTSALDWTDDSWTKTNIGAIAQIWDEASASYELIYDNEGNQIIPAHNGFMVYADIGGGSITIPKDARVHDYQSWFKMNSEQSIRLVAHDLDKGASQQTTIRENAASTEDFDLEFDAYFLSGYAPMFYSVSANKAFALNTLPDFNENTNIPLGFVKNQAANFKIELTRGPENNDLYLTDLKEGFVQNMTMDSVYYFSSEIDDDPNRFVLSFSTVGEQEIEPANPFSIWYFDGKIVVRNEASCKNQLLIFNSAGQIIDQETFNGPGVFNYSAELPTGMYIAKVVNNYSVGSIKFFVTN